MRAKREGFRCGCCGKWHDHVILKPGPKSRRPTLLFPPVARHRLALEQRSGIDASRHHEILHENMPAAVD